MIRKFLMKPKIALSWILPFQHYDDPALAAKEFLEENEKNFKIARQRLRIFRISLIVLIWFFVFYNVHQGSSMLLGYLFAIAILICTFIVLEKSTTTLDNKLVDQAHGIVMTSDDSNNGNHPLIDVLDELRERLEEKEKQLLKKELEQREKELQEWEKQMEAEEKIREQKRKEEESRRKAKEMEERELLEEMKRLKSIRTRMENWRNHNENAK